MNFIVPPTQYPVLLRDFLRSKGVSLTQWRKAKTCQTILVNDEATDPNVYVKAGDRISLLPAVASQLLPADIPLAIVWEDEYLLIVDKPAGLLIHPQKNHMSNSLANAVVFYYQKNGMNLGFHPVLRLDKNTSGLVLIAKYPHIQHLLADRPQGIVKKYLALASGCPTKPEGVIDAPIGRRPSSIIERMVCPTGQRAITKYRVVNCYPDASLVEIELLTGRTHQIRVHFSYIGHPLLGDDLYGGSKELIDRQALHAAELSFIHPVTGQPKRIISPLPLDMQRVLRILATKS